MRTIFEFILGLFILIMFAAAFAIAWLGEDPMHAHVQSEAHRAWVAEYESHTHDDAALEFLRGNHAN